ncbi:MAG: elongation factor P [Anaerolineae bacterium]
MITAKDFRKGTVIEFEGALYRVLDHKHSYIGRGAARVRSTLRNLETGATVERAFGSEERFQDVRLESRQVQYLYREGDLLYFMDTQTYDQPSLNQDILGERILYLKEGQELSVSIHKSRPVEVELPTTVELAVTVTEPGVKGDTATGATKKATLETGLEVQVPLFVEEGDVVRVDTRTGEYATRV